MFSVLAAFIAFPPMWAMDRKTKKWHELIARNDSRRMNRFLFHNPSFDIGKARSMDEARAILKKAEPAFHALHWSLVDTLNDSGNLVQDYLGTNVLHLIASYVHGTSPIRQIMRQGTFFKMLDSELSGFKAELFKFLIKEGADPNVKDRTGRPLLTWLARWGNCPYKSTEMKETLFEAAKQVIAAPDVDLNLKDRKGDNALIWAAEMLYCPLIDELIAAGADVNTQDSYLRTPLILLVENLEEEDEYEMCFNAAQKLIKANADVTLKNKEGQTPRDLAKVRARRHPRIADGLRSLSALLELAEANRIASIPNLGTATAEQEEGYESLSVFV